MQRRRTKGGLVFPLPQLRLKSGGMRHTLSTDFAWLSWVYPRLEIGKEIFIVLFGVLFGKKYNLPNSLGKRLVDKKAEIKYSVWQMLCP